MRFGRNYQRRYQTSSLHCPYPCAKKFDPYRMRKTRSNGLCPDWFWKNCCFFAPYFVANFSIGTWWGSKCVEIRGASERQKKASPTCSRSLTHSRVGFTNLRWSSKIRLQIPCQERVKFENFSIRLWKTALMVFLNIFPKNSTFWDLALSMEVLMLALRCVI